MQLTIFGNVAGLIVVAHVWAICSRVRGEVKRQKANMIRDFLAFSRKPP